MEAFLSFLGKLWDIFLKFWQYELYSVKGGEGITLGVLIIGIVMIFVGYIWSKRLSLQVADKVLTRFDIDESIRASLTQVIFYVLLAIFTLFILHLLKVPVTIFTVLGGGLAIGFGLGAQKILNNFISGIVLMVERPIKVGDLVDADGLQGTVEEIGSRATRIKTINNTHIVVPNSTFLEQNVLNWTLSDNVIRSSVRVGVAYGSDTAQVKESLLQVAKDNSKVLKFPEPVVIFNEFGDNSLVFDLFFFTRMNTFLELNKLGSQLRFDIDADFRARNIVIAFPQRDVHFYPQKPVPVVISNSHDASN
jgi:potassium efflux system protein